MKTLSRVVVFYGAAFVFTIILAILQQVLGIDPEKISMPQFGPGLAALVMLLAFRRDDLKLTVAFKGVPLWKYLAAAGIPIGISMILFLIYGRFVNSVSIPPVDAPSIAIMLGGMLLGAFGEELGWRGYLQKWLGSRLNGLIAFPIVGILWGLWHVGNYSNGPAYVLFFVLSTIGYSAVMAWLIQGDHYNVVPACLFHFAVNAGFFILKDALADVRLMALNGFVWLGAAVVIVLLNRKEFLGRHKESMEGGQ
ncbi:MAG: CPBP family intramembrane metalloprotease [Anaerolineales bacterium]|nr:CPBP family intramembrane metalloprotease [Anaerolineales bacterium]